MTATRSVVIEGSATISTDGLYRYTLTRRWDDGPVALWIMLNPSTADAAQDDPTIRRCITFSQREGCGGLKVVNLYAYRATKPDDLLTTTDPTGPDNYTTIDTAIRDADGPVIAAWGAWWTTQSRRARGPGFPRIVPETFAARHRRTLFCLGVTKEGAPRHPLYVSANQPLTGFPS